MQKSPLRKKLACWLVARVAFFLAMADGLFGPIGDESLIIQVLFAWRLPGSSPIQFFLSLAIRSLKKAKDSSLMPLPFVSLLLAPAEVSLGSESKWEKNLIEGMVILAASVVNGALKMKRRAKQVGHFTSLRQRFSESIWRFISVILSPTALLT
ncbi:hypothetical protein KY290_022950 [Solanum tuberosum]|uniref:Uncharacterized protein n=1 Tax=Solanum tuberosum TaxID=4113 RepID=A0ABQ7V7Y2_SOLTU|nr:hypothetical protein KY289_022016 [Solanum tuberosum]KAH0694653.1 hypothetical protein KY285_021750 [Solanum tuberosum]KAH0759457.1 hypothetical protein KY290_022950 [Solanum tuberosum]